MSGEIEFSNESEEEDQIISAEEGRFRNKYWGNWASYTDVGNTVRAETIFYRTNEIHSFRFLYLARITKTSLLPGIRLGQLWDWQRNDLGIRVEVWSPIGIGWLRAEEYVEELGQYNQYNGMTGEEFGAIEGEIKQMIEIWAFDEVLRWKWQYKRNGKGEGGYGRYEKLHRLY